MPRGASLGNSRPARAAMCRKHVAGKSSSSIPSRPCGVRVHGRANAPSGGQAFFYCAMARGASLGNSCRARAAMCRKHVAGKSSSSILPRSRGVRVHGRANAPSGGRAFFVLPCRGALRWGIPVPPARRCARMAAQNACRSTGGAFFIVPCCGAFCWGIPAPPARRCAENMSRENRRVQFRPAHAVCACTAAQTPRPGDRRFLLCHGARRFVGEFPSRPRGDVPETCRGKIVEFNSAPLARCARAWLRKRPVRRTRRFLLCHGARRFVGEFLPRPRGDVPETCRGKIVEFNSAPLARCARARLRKRPVRRAGDVSLESFCRARAALSAALTAATATVKRFCPARAAMPLRRGRPWRTKGVFVHSGPKRLVHGRQNRSFASSALAGPAAARRFRFRPARRGAFGANASAALADERAAPADVRGSNLQNRGEGITPLPSPGRKESSERECPQRRSAAARPSAPGQGAKAAPTLAECNQWRWRP